uniref:NR LBD domain-containing protein n=1 Tax=Caenorhabditis tropicalis TaxID=1561998 RepID=A0A1I7U443_9PELO
MTDFIECEVRCYDIHQNCRSPYHFQRETVDSLEKFSDDLEIIIKELGLDGLRLISHNDLRVYLEIVVNMPQWLLDFLTFGLRCISGMIHSGDINHSWISIQNQVLKQEFEHDLRNPDRGRGIVMEEL